LVTGPPAPLGDRAAELRGPELPAQLGDVAAELRGPERPLQMADVAGAIGRLRDVEMALFSWLGRTARTLEAADEVVWASAASLRAAWRAAQLEQLLPVSAGLAGAAAAMQPLATATETAIEALDSPEPPGRPGNVPRVASSWYDVLLAAYGCRLRWLSPAADGPLERVLERLVKDLEVEKERCEAVGNFLVGTLDSTVTLSPGQDGSAGSRADPGGRA
jgi:hypothetical protein